MVTSNRFTKNMWNSQKTAKADPTKQVFSLPMRGAGLDLEEEGSLWKTSQNLWVTELKIKRA